MVSIEPMVRDRLGKTMNEDDHSSVMVADDAENAQLRNEHEPEVHVLTVVHVHHLRIPVAV